MPKIQMCHIQNVNTNKINQKNYKLRQFLYLWCHHFTTKKEKNEYVY